MASLFKRHRSPFWWVKFRDPVTGLTVRQSTQHVHSHGPGNRAAREVQAERTLAERRTNPHTQQAAFDVWVKPFLATKYRFNPKSLTRYQAGWRTLRPYLAERKVSTPRQLTREHCFDYLAWRERPERPSGKYRAGRNTALLELKILGMIMKEAVHRGYAPANPARELGLKRAPRRLRPELTDEDYQLMLEHIALKPEPDRRAFERCLLVARYHGVRLNETNVDPLQHVKLWQADDGPRGEITFHQKGNKVRVKPLHPQLIPLFTELQAAGATQTYGPWAWGNRWTRFLRQIGLPARKPNVCFHSTRITVETRLARAGVDKAIRMAYLSHDSQDVNDSYNRFTVDDLRVCHAVAL